MNTNVYHSLEHGRVTVSGTAVQLTSSISDVQQGVTLIAYSGNVGSVYVGGSGVSLTNGFPLKPNLGITIPVDNASKIWVISEQTGNFLHWILL